MVCTIHYVIINVTNRNQSLVKSEIRHYFIRLTIYEKGRLPLYVKLHLCCFAFNDAQKDIKQWFIIFCFKHISWCISCHDNELALRPVHTPLQSCCITDILIIIYQNSMQHPAPQVKLNYTSLHCNGAFRVPAISSTDVERR